MFGAVGEVTDDDPRQAGLALEPDQVILVGGAGQDQPAEPVGHEIGPVGTVGAVDGRATVRLPVSSWTTS